MESKLQILKNKVLVRVNEASTQLGDGTISTYNIEEFLRDATEELLRSVSPYLVPTSDFSTQTVTNKGDGSGRITLPNDFLRLIDFRMQGWERSVTAPLTTTSPNYKRQFNKVLRGGVSKPVAVINNGFLEYYSLPTIAEHRVISAKYIKRYDTKDIPDSLSDPLCWLTASLILSVNNEPEAATIAKQRYVEQLNSFNPDAN